MRTEIESLRTTIDDEGVGALPSGVEGLVENLEGYESAPGASQSAETFAKLKQAAQELKTAAEGSASKQELQAKIDQMLSLADSLPK